MYFLMKDTTYTKKLFILCQILSLLQATYKLFCIIKNIANEMKIIFIWHTIK